MVDFRTKVELPVSELDIRYSDNIMLLGSCFSENMGNLLVESKFTCDVNPFGVLYNPLSIASALGDMLAGRTYGPDDWELFETDCWHSYMHHSRFSAPTRDECLHLINERLHRASDNLRSLDYLLLTFGTAWVYRLASNGCVVANCHKQPDRLFRRELLGVDDIVREYARLVDELLALRPSLQIVFTVSPIRHMKDGLHGNQISKSVLLLAVDRLCSLYPCCHYFPSYEILIDELRDYRFYADDMFHPSSLSISYIWQCFCQSYFSAQTMQVMAECQEIAKAISHRPFRPDSLQYKRFLTQIVLKISRLTEKCPTLDFKNELEICHTRLKP